MHIDPHMIMILVLGGLAWDVLRRFASHGPSQEDLDELHAWIEGMSTEASTWREGHAATVRALEERVSKHAETLNKLGLARLGKGGA